MTTTKLIYLAALVVPGGLAVLAVVIAVRMYQARRAAATPCPLTVWY